MNTLDTPKRRSQILEQKEKLNDTVTTLEQLFNDLHDHFIVLLKLPEPEQEVSTEAGEQTLVSLAHDIRIQRRRIQATNDLIRDMLNRSEL